MVDLLLDRYELAVVHRDEVHDRRAIGDPVEEVLHRVAVLIRVDEVVHAVFEHMLLNPFVRNFKVTLIQHLWAPLSPLLGLSPRNPNDTTENLGDGPRDRVTGGVTAIGRRR
jgi:hypothetical protein